jgi:TonB-linked SusC/RagA family outer membrane protein
MKAFISSALTIMCLVSTPLLEAQTISGSVRDQATGAPLEAVQVFIAGANVGGLSQASGQYLLLNVPVGTHTVTAQLIGYREVSVVVTVAAGQTVVQNLVMSAQALQLDEIVVTGTGTGARLREIGNSVTILDASIAEVRPLQTVTDLLRGRVAGVMIQQGGGMPGAASALKIRGSSTMREVAQTPLIYIDGVRVNNRFENGTRDVNRMDDLDPAMIESIEVIKGPAAATLYGTEAANGVIQIITKRGQAGLTQWNFTMRQGAAWFADPATHTPTNWAVSSVTDAALGLTEGQVGSFNVLENEAERSGLFRNAHNQYYGLDVSGGTAAFQYFVSGSVGSEQGATFNSWAKRYNGRVNISAQPTDDLTIAANMGFNLLRMRMAGDYPYEEAVRSTAKNLGPTGCRGTVPSGVLCDKRGYDRYPPEQWVERQEDYHEANRMTAGVTVNHDPSAWFSQRLTFGLDLTDQLESSLDNFLTPVSAQFWRSRDAAGNKSTGRESVLYSTFDYGASAIRELSSSLRATSSAGFQVYSKSIENVSGSGSGFPALGLASVSATGDRSGSESLTENNTVGVYFQQQLGWNDKFFITAAVRADDNSAFGESFDLVYYPKISGSWVVREGGGNFINAFRLRGAYGESGQQPDAFDAIRSYTTRASPSGSATVRPDAPGNTELGPERGQEIELGFDASFLNDRVSLDFTYYDQKTTDAIVGRRLAPSQGFLDRQFVNVGEISNKGIEVALNARIIDGQSLAWDVGLNLATNNNKVVDLGLDAEFLSTGWTSRHVEGRAVGSMFAPDVIFAEFLPNSEQINRDTMRCDNGHGQPVICNEAAWIYQGHPDPTVDGYLTTGISIGDLTIDAMFQGRFGQTKYSLQGWWRWASRKQAKLNVLPLEHDDINEVAEAQYGSSGEFDLWVNEASFIRFKELSLSYAIPESLAAKVGSTRGTVSLASRNLAMLWTNWPEWPHHDPEIVDATSTFTQEPQEDSGIPPLTSITLTIRLTR